MLKCCLTLGDLLRYKVPRARHDSSKERLHWYDISWSLQYDDRTAILGIASTSACRGQPNLRSYVQSSTLFGRLSCLGSQVSANTSLHEDCWLLAELSCECSMLVDPTGKVQTELDENEGIAFGEIGEETHFTAQAQSLTQYLLLDRCRID